MKRLASSDSLGALMPIGPGSADEQGNNPLYAAMMDGYDEDQESCQLSGPEKKRRLSADQVRALEKNFEVENKLDPDRKAKLAQDLALQPRQVAVWFQNRRARWKTKQLERDYAALKADYDGLTLDFENLHRDNEALIEEIRELKSKAKVENCDSEKTAEEEAPEIKNSAQIKGPSSSDSCDSSAILSDGVPNSNNDFRSQDYQQPQLVKIEEHNFFGEESCSTLFSEDQAPSLHWYESEWS